MDLKSTRDSYVLQVDMGGVKSEDIKVELENGTTLVITGELKREAEKKGEKYLQMGRKVGSFSRTCNLRMDANPNKITSVYKDGLLTITVERLPPPPGKKLKRIKVVENNA